MSSRSSLSAIDPRIAHLVDQLTGAADLQRIVLFGSRARGDAEDRSDIDLAIEAPRLTREEWFQLMDCVEAAETLLPIQVIRFEEASPHLQDEINREGVVLYERSSNMS